jgi:hypothetical protein
LQDLFYLKLHLGLVPVRLGRLAHNGTVTQSSLANLGAACHLDVAAPVGFGQELPMF